MGIIARTMVSVFLFVINVINGGNFKKIFAKAAPAECEVPLEWYYYNSDKEDNDFSFSGPDAEDDEPDLLDKAIFVEGGENPTADIYDYQSNYVWAQDRAGNFMLVPEGLIGPGLRRIF